MIRSGENSDPKWKLDIHIIVYLIIVLNIKLRIKMLVLSVILFNLKGYHYFQRWTITLPPNVGGQEVESL